MREYILFQRTAEWEHEGCLGKRFMQMGAKRIKGRNQLPICEDGRIYRLLAIFQWMETNEGE